MRKLIWIVFALLLLAAPLAAQESTPSVAAERYETLIIVIGAVLLAVLSGVIWLAHQSNKKLERSVPIEVALRLAEYLAKSTPTLKDDELLAEVERLLEKLFAPEAPPAPEPPAATTRTPYP